MERSQSTEWFGVLFQQFGIPQSAFEGLRLHQPNAKMLYIVNANHDAPSHPSPDSQGMGFLRIDMVVPKITTGGAMAFGHAATKNFVILNERQVQCYLSRQAFHVTPEQISNCTGRGHVILKYNSLSLGVGFLEHGMEIEANEYMVRSQFPKAWSISHDCDALGI